MYFLKVHFFFLELDFENIIDELASSKTKKVKFP